jgi:hypothetical protein
LEAELPLNLSQIYWRLKLVWKNLKNSLKFLFTLHFQIVNLDWHGCMTKSKVSIQALLGFGLKEKKRVFEFEFKLNHVHLLLIPRNYKMKHCRLQGKAAV